MRTLPIGRASRAPSRHDGTTSGSQPSAAVKHGVPAESLRSLADLVSPPVVRLILEHYLAKKGGKIVTFTIDMAERLYAIARTYVKAPEEQLRRARAVLSQTSPKRRHGMTEKNMAVIRAFKDPQNRARLKALPGQLFDEALAERDALIQAAVKAAIALAIQIELVAPMRVANLAALQLEMNVIRVGGARAHLPPRDPSRGRQKRPCLWSIPSPRR